MRSDTGGKVWPERFFSRIDPERMFARHGGLRWYVLYLLSNGSKRGIDIMEEMEKRSWGYWRPSPGSIYPLLKSLESEGLIKKEDSGYVLTDAGRDVMGINKTPGSKNHRFSEGIDKAISDMESYLEYLEDARGELDQYQDRLRSLSAKLAELTETKTSKKR